MAKKFPQPGVVIHLNPSIGVFLVVSYQCWGRAATLPEANAICKRSGGRPDEEWTIYSAHKDTTIDEMGRFRYPKDFPPILLCHSPRK